MPALFCSKRVRGGREDILVVCLMAGGGRSNAIDCFATGDRYGFLVRFINLSVGLWLWAALCLLGGARHFSAEAHDAGNPPNSLEQRKKPYVLLVSIDGFRHDYAESHGATNLLALARRGTQAESLIPVFPSLTFPVHYSIVTGLRPERHGVVAMKFYDPDLGAGFDYTDGHSATEGRWFGGTPLWVLAEKQGMRSAAFFWVGSEAEIQGIRPSYWVPYDQRVPHDTRVKTVLEWFHLPEELRPHFVMTYFSDVDTAGHRSGPESEGTREAVRNVDKAIGALMEGVGKLALPVNVIVLSDHGMVAIERDSVELAELVDFGDGIVSRNGSQVMFYGKDEASIDRVYAGLRGKDSRFEVYKRSDIPAKLQYSNNPRIGDIVVLPTGRYMLSGDRWRQPGKRPVVPGMHGYDPAWFPEMNGLFIAAGPSFRAGTKRPAINAVDVYPLIATILKLKPPMDLDGDLNRVRPFIR